MVAGARPEERVRVARRVLVACAYAEEGVGVARGVEKACGMAEERIVAAGSARTRARSRKQIARSRVAQHPTAADVVLRRSIDRAGGRDRHARPCVRH